MTHDELARRRPLWAAMADLFLDTETRWSTPFIAARCVESGYDDEALERIFWAEVFPEAIGNLLQVAGEWAALDLDEQALIRRANSGAIPWLSRRAHGRMVEREWLLTRTLTAWLREVKEAERPTHVRALDGLLHRYLTEPERETALGDAAFFAGLEDTARLEWQRLRPVVLAHRWEGDPPHEPACEAVDRVLGVG